MEIALTPEAERFVQAQVESGHFRDASEVVNAVLKKFVDRADARGWITPRTPRTMDELEACLLESIERLDRGEGIDGETAYAKLRKRIEKHSSK
jgi:antitoxin ParD1/3/4